MRKFKDTLLFIIDGKIWGSQLFGHPDERKGWFEEPFVVHGRAATAPYGRCTKSLGTQCARGWDL
jgi:hypothetical protein